MNVFRVFVFYILRFWIIKFRWVRVDISDSVVQVIFLIR